MLAFAEPTQTIVHGNAAAFTPAVPQLDVNFQRVMVSMEVTGIDKNILPF